MWIESIFYLVFISQVVIISYYYPSQILARVDYVLTHYPADKYAKLYPKGCEETLEGKILYKMLNIIIFIIGVIGFTVFVVSYHQGKVSLEDVSFLPLAYGMLQAVPFIMLELSAFKQLKLMRSKNNQSKRQADLSPRSIFNYLNPTLFYSAVSMLFLCVYLIFSFNQFNFSETIATLIIAMLLCNGLFVGMGFILLRGKKLDPHQSEEDRRTMIKTTFKSYAWVSMLVSLFFIINQSVDYYGLQSWEPIFNSLYWQAVLLLSTGATLKLTKLDEINYEVYRSTPSSTN